MSKYINAEYLKAVMINDRLLQGNAEFTLYAQEVEMQVNALPSIDIVHCEECRWKNDCSQVVPNIERTVDTALRWCSDGERIDNE